MDRNFFFITHPDVVIDPARPIPDWGLSARGFARMQQGAESQHWLRALGSLYSSTERKAVEAAQVLTDAIGLPATARHGLGENGREATGYLPRDEFERTADAFFERPEYSVRGWERAVDAQRRIVAAVGELVATPGTHPIGIVSHGAVGALLRCHLAGVPISRAEDQPAGHGGHWFSFTWSPRAIGPWCLWDA